MRNTGDAVDAGAVSQSRISTARTAPALGSPYLRHEFCMKWSLQLHGWATSTCDSSFGRATHAQGGDNSMSDIPVLRGDSVSQRHNLQNSPALELGSPRQLVQRT